MKKINLYYTVRFFFDFIVVYPFYTLVFVERGQDAASIGWLMAIWSLAVVIFELPMGLLSDRLERRTLLLWAVVCKALAFSCWLIPGSFWSLAAGFMLWGLSIAMASGTDEAWLYETLHANGKAADYARVRGRSNIASALGIAVAAPLGGWLAQYGLSPLIWISIGATLIAGLCILGLGCPPRTSEPNTEGAGSLWGTLPGALQEIRSNPLIVLMLLCSGLIFIISGVLDEWDTLYLSKAGFLPLVAGTWVSVRLGFESLGYLLAHRIQRPRPLLVILSAALSGLLLLGMGLQPALIWLLPYGLYALIYAGITVLADTWIQTSMHGSRRATILSLKSLMENAFGLLMIVAAGYAAQQWGYPFLWLAAAVYSMLMGALLALAIVLMKKNT